MPSDPCVDHCRSIALSHRYRITPRYRSPFSIWHSIMGTSDFWNGGCGELPTRTKELRWVDSNELVVLAIVDEQLRSMIARALEMAAGSEGMERKGQIADRRAWGQMDDPGLMLPAVENYRTAHGS